MTIMNKLKWVLGILLVFLLVLATNLIDRNNFVSVRDSIVTIYEDRLIANDILFDLSAAIHEKELAITRIDSAFFSGRNNTLNTQIEELLASYEATKLTDEEQVRFSSLKKHLNDLSEAEANLAANGFTNPTAITNTISAVKDDLKQLSKIQLSEGRKQMLKSNRTIDLVELYTQIEIVFLVFLAVLFQIIVLYRPRSKE